MANLFCVRAEFGKYSDNFVKGGYVGIGWLDGVDLSSAKSRDDIEELFKKHNPMQKNQNVIGQQTGQISRFVFDLKTGDYVITPSEENEYLYYGEVVDGKYHFEIPNDGCHYHHRKKVKWENERLQRSLFSVPFQNTIRSTLTIYSIKHQNEFFNIIGKKALVVSEEIKAHDSNSTLVLNRILQLDAFEFELLVTKLLEAVGFDSKHTGKSGDGGVDAEGELDMYGMAKIHVIVQAKRYQPGTKINKKTVKELRQSIPNDAQGVFITTADYDKEALKIAVEPGFQRIGTINGKQLVDLLSEKWEDLDLDEEMRAKLGLKRGLIVE